MSRIPPGLFTPPPWPVFRAGLVVVVLALLHPLGSASAAAAKISFDIPAGSAGETLKRFSAQSGDDERLLYSSANIDGIRTNTVKGQMTPRAALDRMFAGTELVVVEDRRNGALSLARAADPKAPRAAQTAASDRPRQNPADGTAGAPTASGDTTADSFVELSPFTVSSERDVGYIATNALGGSRLNTPLKDTAASISILTSEFLSDIGALNVEQAVAYSANLQNELSEEGPAGNRLLEFHTSYRVRGIRASAARNYFVWSLPTNLYNIERIEQSRGPNSILFGLGSAGGIINSSTKQPVTGRRFATVGLSAGSYESYQATLDLNQPLLDGKAGLRFNAVREDRETFRHYEFSRTQAAHLSGKWNLYENTTIRIEGELGYVEDNKARAWTLRDQISVWDFNGRPTLPTQVANPTLGIARLAANMNRVTVIDNTGQLFDLRGTLISNVPAPANQLMIQDRGIVDYSVNPNGPGAVRSTDFNTYTATVEQRLGEDIFLALAYNRQTYDFLSYDPDHVAHILFGDPNLHLPTGAGNPNPNAGDFFIESNWFRRTRAETIDNLRLSASTAFDWGKFGNYRIAALVERQRNEFQNDQKRESWAGAPFGGLPEAMSNLVYRRTYVTEGDWASYRLNGGQGRLVTNQLDPVSGRTLSSTWVQSPTTALNDDPSQLETVLAGLEARYFDGRLVAIAGVRRDRLHNEDRGAVRDPVTGVFVVDYATIDESDFTDDTHSFGLVAHVRPWLSLHYNRSTNNSLPNVSHLVLPDASRAPGALGKGADVGFALNLLNDKAYFKATYYTTDSREETDFRTVNQFTGPNGNNNRVLAALVAAGPAGGGISEADAAPRRTAANVAKFDRAGDGYEFELVANPTPRWRVSLNYTISNLVESNVGDEVVAFANEQIAYWRQFDTGLVTSLPATIEAEIADVERDLQTLTGTNGLGAIGNRRDKVSFFTRYSFGPGRLQGFFVGGGYRYQSGRLAARGTGRDLLFGNSLTQVDALLGWRHRIFSNRTMLNLQLNVTNLLDFDTPQTTILSPAGGAQRFELVAPRSFRLSARLEF